MEYLYIVFLIFILSGFYFFYREFRDFKEHRMNDSQKIFADTIEHLRMDVRNGLDKNSESLQKRLDETLKLLDQQFHNVRNTVDTRITENTKDLNQRLDSAAKIMYGVKEELGRMKEVSDQIKKLQEVLGGQKLRGNLGEQIMHDLISQVIPAANYTFQHRFRSGDIVDAVIKTQNGLISIDSKFPFENFKRLVSSSDEKEKELASKEFSKDVKKHMSDIHKKYIKPEEGTLDFAFMYVPADSVFFEIIVNMPELSQFAQDKHVYVVSPSMFYSALQIILLSYQSQKFEEHAKEVISLIQGVKKESKKFGENLNILNKHVTNAKSKMDEVCHGYVTLDTKIHQVDRGENHLIAEEAKKDENNAL